MKHIIIGTAGHIDHGKTTLIKAITGRNTDRLKEEQKRGISIELGFTYFDLPSGQRAGIIDVPGHERFIKNMLAGVIGIDIVMLVIAADEGLMPQTLEHLAILDLLGIKKGFVVLTKTDMVEDEWMSLVEEEVKEELVGTFLESRPIVRVSSIKNEGIKDVIDLLEESIMDLEDRNLNDTPRLPVDRVFIIPGFGTVATGTLLSGSFKIGDEVQVFPSEKTARIRTLQVHDEDAEIGYGGQRLAMNLAGLKKEDIDRGSTISYIGAMEKTMMLDVKVRLLKSIDRIIANRTRLKLYIGTKEVLCRIILLDREELKPSEEAFAQLRLEEEIVAKRGDKFIIRFYSPMFTIGGGEILDSNPQKRKRFDKEALKILEVKAQGNPKEILEKVIMDKSKEFPNFNDLALATSTRKEDLEEDIAKLIFEGRIIKFVLTKESYLVHRGYFIDLKDKIVDYIENYHRKYPLRKGISKEEIRSKFLNRAKPKVGEALIDRLILEGYLDQEKEFIKVKDFNISFNKEQEKLKRDIIAGLEQRTFMITRQEEIEQKFKGQIKDFNEIFNILINEEIVLKLAEDAFILKDYYYKSIEKVREFFSGGVGFTVAEFRDLLDVNRKTALTLLEHFDKEKITKRDGDTRQLLKN